MHEKRIASSKMISTQKGKSTIQDLWLALISNARTYLHSNKIDMRKKGIHT